MMIVIQLSFSQYSLILYVVLQIDDFRTLLHSDVVPVKWGGGGGVGGNNAHDKTFCESWG